MSDFESINDLELQELEQRLVHLELPPSDRQRQQLMYSCGQAAGRTELRRQVRTLATVAATLACVSIGLTSYVALSHVNSQETGRLLIVNEGDSNRATDHHDSTADHNQRDVDILGRRMLTASSNFEQLRAFDERQRTTAQNFDGNDETYQHVLTVTGHSGLQEFWD